MSSRDFTGAGIQRHSSGSRPISQSPAWCSSVSGSRRMCRPWRVTGWIWNWVTAPTPSRSRFGKARFVELPLQVRIKLFEDVEQRVVADLNAHSRQDTAHSALVLWIVKLRDRAGSEIAKKLRIIEAVSSGVRAGDQNTAESVTGAVQTAAMP